jgi:GNAT superfamily N-acetyltransferase
MVVLPDYQGIGIGIKFINEVSKHYIEKGLNMNLTTTTPALVGGLSRNDKWSLVRADRVKNTLGANLKKYYGDDTRSKDKSIGSSSNRITYSFNFKK